MSFQNIWHSMETQTKIATLGYLMVVVSHVIIVVSLVKQPSIGLRYIVFLLLIPLSLYIVNCTVVGKCDLYAYIYSSLVFIWGLFLLFAVLFFLLSNK